MQKQIRYKCDIWADEIDCVVWVRTSIFSCTYLFKGLESVHEKLDF